MKLKQPILFHTLEELHEAVEYKVIKQNHIKFYISKEYTLPTLFYPLLNNKLEHQSGNDVLLNQNDNYLPILRKSIDWKNIKDKYKPKKWYKLKSSINNPVWVRDSDDNDWNIDIFQGFNESNTYKFKCINADWKQAKPVMAKDLINEV